MIYSVIPVSPFRNGLFYLLANKPQNKRFIKYPRRFNHLTVQFPVSKRGTGDNHFPIQGDYQTQLLGALS